MKRTDDFVFREKDAGYKELLSMLIYRPLARLLLLGIFRHLSVTPNQITFFSLVLIAVGCCFFAFSPYPYILIGIFFLHLGYVFDMLDGQYARYKGLTSKFGQWLDPFLDVIKTALIFISLSYGAYVAEGNPAALIWGLVALTHSFLAYYIMNTRNQIIKGHTFEVKLKGNVYVGYEVNLYWLVSLIVLFNRLYLGIVFLGIFGVLGWIKVYWTLSRYYITHKKELEKES